MHGDDNGCVGKTETPSGASGNLGVNLVLCAGLLGLATGSEGDLLPFVIRKGFGMRAYGRLYGLMFGIFQIGGVFGPFAMAIAYDPSANTPRPSG